MTIPATTADNKPTERPKWSAGEIALVILAAIVLAWLLWMVYQGTGPVGTGMF